MGPESQQADLAKERSSEALEVPKGDSAASDTAKEFREGKASDVKTATQVEIEARRRPPVPSEPCCALCKHSVQWAQQMGQVVMRHPFFVCKCEEQPAERRMYWRTPDALCDLYYELDPARLKPVKIAVPNGIRKKLII